MSVTASEPLVCVAAVATAHGVRGALKLRCFTEAPENVGAYGPVCDENGRELFTLDVLRPIPGGVVARAPGIETREAAERLRGKRLYVPRSRLPEPDEADEFYLVDLLGLDAVASDGRTFGKVSAVQDHGAGDIIEITRTDGTKLDLPFTRVFVPEVDLAIGRLVVALPGEVMAEAGR